jgi:probable rRNA maturation factor
MAIEVDVQQATDFQPLPGHRDFKLWVVAALQEIRDGELTLRLVDEAESRELNSRYRGKDAPTNVLSFPAGLPPGIDVPLLGDIVICAPLVHIEAMAQNKPVQAHWAHLVIHGVLHLLGHDHQDEQEAGVMEALEVDLLFSLGYANPYQEVP